MQKRNKKPSLVLLEMIGYMLLFFTFISLIFDFFSITISSLIGIISMLLILPESIDFFIYILKNYPQGSFAPYKGRIITLPLVLIIFVVLFIISLKK